MITTGIDLTSALLDGVANWRMYRKEARAMQHWALTDLTMLPPGMGSFYSGMASFLLFQAALMRCSQIDICLWQGKMPPKITTRKGTSDTDSDYLPYNIEGIARNVLHLFMAKRPMSSDENDAGSLSRTLRISKRSYFGFEMTLLYTFETTQALLSRLDKSNAIFQAYLQTVEADDELPSSSIPNSTIEAQPDRLIITISYL